MFEITSYSEIEYCDDILMIEATPNFSDCCDPYIRVYSGSFPFNMGTSKDIKMCRISLLEPKVIGLKDEDLTIDDKIINSLINALKSKPKYKNTLNHYANTVWESIIEDLNNIHNEYDKESETGFEFKNLNIDLPIPDYHELLKRR